MEVSFTTLWQNLLLVFTGRIVYVFNRFFHKKLVKLAGLKG